MFVTLAIVVIDPAAGRCRYLSAGHNPAVLGRGGIGFGYLEPAEGILAGVMPDATFSALELELSVGDVLLLYTDGVTEAMNGDKVLYGESRLLDCLNDRPAESASELIGRVTEDVHRHADGEAQSDDLTMVAVRFLSD